ncbi:MAG: hypothetical protein A2157_12680 [Deltaproteobacteria bacterium RBG_16_47_11]|nr:MAG: hypothetical protein A2157_12680 [Deltaproteobacteria bacterium RBG_16_47_11]
MGEWEEGVIGSRVNGMMSIKLKTRGKYFKFANLESIFRNDMKRVSRVGIGRKVKENSESPA